MKKIAASKFSGEKEEGEDVVLAGDHHPPLLTSNNQQVIWYGGRVILPPILEENLLTQLQASSNQTHEVGAPSTSSAIPAPAVVYNPMPLRCFLPPTVDFNGIHIPTGEVDTAFGVSNYVPRKTDEIKKRTSSNNLMPDLGRLRHDSFSGVEVDDVDTVLSLRLPGTTDPKKSRKQAKGKGHTPTGNMSNLGWLRLPPDFFDGVEDDEVDTTLSLRPPGTTDTRKSRMQKGKGKALDHHNHTGDMSNLGWLRPGFFDGVEDDEVDTTLSLRPPGTADPKKSRMQEEKGKKRKADAGDSTERKKTSKRRSIGEEENPRPLIPIEEIPALMKAVESRNGSRPRFLYRKILVDSDRKSGLNRLFVTRRDEMMNFLRAEEKAAVDNQDVGQKIVGVDGGGNVYDNLVLKVWNSLKMTVINSDWRKVVEANEAETGDVVEIWGFRGVDEKPCFAFNFRKQNAAGASTSGTSGNDESTSMA